VDAARDLFDEVGFQRTTIRMIAEKARLSPGGVFTTFEDKVAILCHIVGEHRARLFEEIARVAPTLDGSTRDRVLRIIAMFYADEFSRMGMVAAYLGASYSWDQASEDSHHRLLRPLVIAVDQVLRDGVARGEIAADVDLELLQDTICAVFQHNYRAAQFAHLDEADLNARVARQIGLLFDGVAPPPSSAT